MGCPGTSITAPVLGTRLGDTVIQQGYPAPRLFNNYSLSTGTINNVMDNQANPSGLDADGACACCCSGMNGGMMPTWTHTYFYVSSDNQIRESTWPTEKYIPGGTTGIYINNVGSVMYFFNVGQLERCGRIGAGVYDARILTGIGWATWYYDVIDWVMKWALLGGAGPSVFVNTDNESNGMYGKISLCVPCWQIGAHQDVQDVCEQATCANPMDYGTQQPSIPIPGPGHNLNNGGISYDCLPPSTVWSTCVDDPCTPNGYCPGPPSVTAPTGCLERGSPLTNNPSDNVCYDCEGKPLFHPCYGSTAANPTNYGTWGDDGPDWDVWFTAGTINGYGCQNTRDYEAGAWLGGFGHIDYVGTDYYDDYKHSPSAWDSCCVYDSYGCPNPSWANFNAIAALDCAGNSDPGSLTWYGADPDDPATFGLLMCPQAGWLNWGGGGYGQLASTANANEFTWIIPLFDPATGFPVNAITGLPDATIIPPAWVNGLGESAVILSQGTADQSGGADVPCNTLTMNGQPNSGGHPLSWSRTGYASADQCCCNNDGCTDQGQGGTQWNNSGTPPPDGGAGNVYPTSLPWGVISTLGLQIGGYGWQGTAPTYYQGYNVTIGSSSPINLIQTPIGASNFCYGCVGDCNGDPIGTFLPGWADCCYYQIPGCMEDTSGPNPDIFGTGPTYLVWNYNPLATYDDGSCFYDEPILGCIDDGGIGGLSNVMGPYLAPTHPGIPANNYDPDANIMALGTCTWNEGCPDPLAINYDPCADPNELANIVLGMHPACIVIDVNGNTLPGWYPSIPNPLLCDYAIPGAGPGCMDPQALNFNPLATTDCGDNLSLPPPYPADFTCCIYPIEGCTDPNAWNYNVLAVIDDGSCEYQLNPFQEGVNFLDGTKVLLCRDPLTKEEVLMNVCEPPEIQSEIFIERGKQTVFEPNQRLGEIKTMGGLTNHGYGYYKIKKQE